MANANFKVKNGLDVGSFTVNATNGDISTPGNIRITGTGTLTVDSGLGLDLGNINITGNTISAVNTNGDIQLSANGTGGVILPGSTLYRDDNGTRAQGFEASAALTNAQAVFAGNVNDFLQFAMVNTSTGTDASVDMILYANDGDNDSGWVDLGMTNNNFTAAAFGITQAGDGYLFMSAPATSSVGGNLVICTDATGTTNDIVFATGGFDSTREQGRFISDDGFQVKGNLISNLGSVYQGPNARSNLDTTSVSTTLNGAINDSTTTITVVSTTGFDGKGIITIDSEEIKYSAKTSTQFTGCTRGLNGTTAASHSNGATVGQDTFAGLTNATAVFTGDADDFVQLALRNENSNSSASTDFIAYASDGDNSSGWIDMGITSETYADPGFTVTGPGTGYLFFSAPSSTSGTGDLLIGTDHTGSQNDITFFTNGFAAGNERVRIVGQSRVGKPAGVEVYISTASTSTSTGALRVQGGMGLQGNLYVGGNVNIAGNITLGGSGDTVSTNNLAVENSYISLATNNAGNSVDIGFVGKYVSSGTKYTGLIRDASDNKYKLFEVVSSAPTTTVDFTSATYGAMYLSTLEAVGTNASSSTTTGAVVVAGGVGIAGNLYAGGSAIRFTGNVVSTSTGTGTLVVTGGIGVTGNVVAGGTFQGTATSAQYADLAENYLSDAAYEPGTVVEFGGLAEVTIAEDSTRRVAGVISTAPAHLMNSHLSGNNVVAVALTGRVPCKVRGKIRKGDMLVAGGNGYARPESNPMLGSVIGKALNDFDGADGIIEVVVGRL